MEFLQSILRWVVDLLQSPNVQATIGEFVANWLIMTIPQLEEYRTPLIGIAGAVYAAFIVIFNGIVQPAALRATGASFQALQARGRAQSQAANVRPQNAKASFDR